VKEYLDAHWDRDERKFSLNGWEEDKDEITSMVLDKIEDIDLCWTRDHRRELVDEVTVEELALVYYAIKKSNQWDRNKNSSKAFAFSYHQVRECFQLVYGRKPHRAKVAKIFKVLQEAEMIYPIERCCVGSYGNKYRVVDL
jgi:hypothetical protein